MLYSDLMSTTPFQKLEAFFAQFRLISYKKNETILRSDDQPPGVFYLKRGYVKLYSLCREGEELSLIIFKPEDFFPIGWAINNKVDPYYLDAMTSVELWRAPREEFVKFIKENPDVLFELTSRILIRLGGLLQRMEHLVFGNAGNKVASILVICAERFGRPAGKAGKKEDQKIIVQLPLTHRDIANLAGITRETASLEIKKLEREGLISHRQRLLVVRNLKKLEKESLLNGST